MFTSSAPSSYADSTKPQIGSERSSTRGQSTPGIRRAGDEQLASAADAVREIAAALEASRQQQRELEARLESMASVAEAPREAAGESVGEDLSEFYTGRAQAHERGWQRWRIALVVAIGCAVAGSLAVVLVKRPEGDITDGEVISRLLVDLLIIGHCSTWFAWRRTNSACTDTWKKSRPARPRRS